VGNLAESLASGNIDRARAEIRKLVGDFQVIATPDEIRLETREGAVEAALLRAAGERQAFMVAGQDFSKKCIYMLIRSRWSPDVRFRPKRTWAVTYLLAT
jgi:hypothetical protein